MKHIIHSLSILGILALLCTSCNSKSPAGFWARFHKDLLVTHHNNQGPKGGTRELEWKSSAPNTFTALELLDFAGKHEWQLEVSHSFVVDSLPAGFSQLKTDEYSMYLVNHQVVSRLGKGSYTLFVFKTTWLAVEPGNAGQTFQNGFAVLNTEGTFLRVYHCWGE